MTLQKLEDNLCIPGFNIELPQAWEEQNTARIITYCDKNVTYRKLPTNKNEADLKTISIEIGKTRKFMLNSTYRKHTGCASGMSTVEAQQERLKRQI